MSQPHRQTAARISEELDIHVITLYRSRKTWRLHGEVPVAAPTPPPRTAWGWWGAGGSSGWGSADLPEPETSPIAYQQRLPEDS